MSEYKIQTDEDGEILECANCGAEVETRSFNFKPYDIWTQEETDLNLCEICSDTYFSRATTRKNWMSDTEQLLFKSIAKALNIIRQDIKKKTEI